MRDRTRGFDTELRISPGPVLVLQTILVIAAILIQIGLPEPRPLLDPTLALLILTGITWVLVSRYSEALRWLLVVESAAIVGLLELRLPLPGLYGLYAVPVILGAALVGRRWLPVLTAAESLLVLGSRAISAGDPGMLIAALAVIWATFAVTLTLYRPILGLAEWSWAHYEHSQSLLDEARDRQMELKQALEDLAHANRQLALMNERVAAARLLAENAEKVKAAFVANVSHEFRTPLNMIIGLVDLVSETPEVYEGAIPAALLKDLEIVHRNCEHLSSMVDDVLDLSRLEAKRLALHMGFVDLTVVLDQALSVVRPLLEKKGLWLRLELDTELPEVYCDATRIRQVLLNLVSNAARFTERGGITVRAAQREREVVISVADTGPGISEEDAARIFEPFEQASASSPHGLGGTGLGLSISRSFVELHNGRMWLESRLGEGSTFYFALPVSPPADHVAPPEHWIVEGWVQRRSNERLIGPHQQRIILCDETAELYPMLEGQADDVELVEHRSLMEAAEALQESGAQAVILNAASAGSLPQRLAEARSLISDVPVIGCCIPPRERQAVEAGAVQYLIKPITRARLLAVLESLPQPVRSALIVDDEPDAVSLLTRLLRAQYHGIAVATAGNGTQALDELRKSPPDVMLLDIVLPEMDGWQVLAAKRQEEAIRDVPVVLVSAQDPQNTPARSEMLVATMGRGLSIGKLLECSQQLATLLTKPD